MGGLAMRPKSIILFSVLVISLVLLTGCSRTNNDSRTTLRLSMIPTTDPGKIVRESQPFIDYLQRKTGAKVELTVPTNYAAVVEAVSSDRVDIACFGGFTFVQASARAGALPLVQRERDQNLPFLRSPSSTPLILWSVTILSTYLVWHLHALGGSWSVPLWVTVLEYLPVPAAAAFVLVRAFQPSSAPIENAN
jgi:hypothetical protein